MPNVRVNYGGPTVFEGFFLGDDDAGLSTVEHHVAHAQPEQGGHDVQLDASNIHGTIIATHAANEHILTSLNEATQVQDFSVDKDSKMTVHDVHIENDAEVDGKLTVTEVDGTAVSHLDVHTVNAANTLVKRHPATGCVSIANLRVPSRENALDANGHAPDGFPPGLFTSKATVTEELRLAQDARVFFEPAEDNYYRFGAVEGHIDDGRHIDKDGLHFSSGTGDQLNSARLRVSRDHPTLTIVGNKNSADLASIHVQDENSNVTFFVKPSGVVQGKTGNFIENMSTRNLLLHYPLVDEVGDVMKVTNALGHAQIVMKSDGDVRCNKVTAEIVDTDVMFRGPLLDLKSLVGNQAFSGQKHALIKLKLLDGTQTATLYDSGEIAAGRVSVKPVAASAEKQALIVGTNHAGVVTFRLYDTGEIVHNIVQFVHIAGPDDIGASVHSSVVADDDSVYIGSSRYSYDRANHVMTLHRLKLGHIPVYLQGLNFTAADLPGGHVENDMTVQKWLVHARTHLGEEELDVKHLFPTTNDDWDVIDAPVPALKADVQALQAFVTGADADINTLETEMDTAELDINQLENAMGTAQTDINTLEAEMNTAQAEIVVLQGASGGLGASETMTNLNGNVELTLSATGSPAECSLKFSIDDTSASNNDRDWEFRTQYGSHSELRLVTGGNEVFRAYGPGGISFGGGNVNTGGFQVWRDAWFYDSFRCKEDSVFEKSVTVSTELTISSTPVLQTLVAHAVSIGANAAGVVANAAGVVTAIAVNGPSLEINSAHMNPGGYTNWPILNVKTFVHNTTQASRYRLPEFPEDGQSILIMTAGGATFGTINLHTGAWGTPGRTFHAASTGLNGTVQCDLNNVGMQVFHVTYIASSNQWLLI